MRPYLAGSPRNAIKAAPISDPTPCDETNTPTNNGLRARSSSPITGSMLLIGVARISTITGMAIIPVAYTKLTLPTNREVERQEGEGIEEKQ